MKPLGIGCELGVVLDMRVFTHKRLVLVRAIVNSAGCSQTMDRRIVSRETHKTFPFLMLFSAAGVSAIVAASNGWTGRPLALLKTIVLSISYQWWKI